MGGGTILTWDQLWQFIMNIRATRQATVVDGREIRLDQDILAEVFRVPEGNHKVELPLRAAQTSTYEPREFNEEATCINGYYVKKCSNELVLNRLLFQR